MLLALVCCFDTARAQTNPLSANPSALTFNTQTGVTPAAQTVLLTSSSGPLSVSVTAFSGNFWLVVSPSSGTTPLSLTVSINTANAPTSGTDSGFISVTSSSASVTI